MTEIIKNKIYTLDNFFSNKQCDVFIKQIDDKTKCRNFTASAQFKNDKYVDSKMADILFSKIKQHIDVDKMKIIRAGDLIMAAKYIPGEEFGIHTDTGSYYDKIKKEKSMFTFFVFLNDNFEGGETIFYNDMLQEIVRVNPVKGRGLLFDLNQFHQGNMVNNGDKYWLGCELIINF